MSSGTQRESAASISATKAEALALLTEICALSPDVRLGQLFAHVGFLGEDQTGRTLWDVDDEALLAVLYAHHAELVNRDAVLMRPRNESEGRSEKAE